MLLSNHQMKHRATLILFAVFTTVSQADIYPDGSCPIFSLLPFTSSYKVPDDIQTDNINQYNPFSPATTSQIAYSFAASALLAMDDFNQRNASVVPELAELDKECTVYFPDPQFVDSRTDSAVSVRALWDASGRRNRNPPCAVLGPATEKSNFDLLPALSSFSIPMLVYAVENDQLASPDTFGTVTTTLSSTGRAKAMVEYLKNREYLAIWYQEGGDALAEAIQQVVTEYDLKVSLHEDEEAPDGVDAREFRKQKLFDMKQTGYSTIFVSVGTPADMPEFAELLDELGMLDPGYVYILPPMLVPVETVEVLYGEQIPDSPLDKLLSGAVVFNRLDGFSINQKDRFLASWKQQNSTTVDRLNTLVPLPWLKAAPDYFQTANPAAGASFIYDSVISIGLGACTEQKHDRENPAGGNKETTSDSSNSTDLPPGYEPPPGFQPPLGFTIVPPEKRKKRAVFVPGFSLRPGGSVNGARRRRLEAVTNGTLINGVLKSSFYGASGPVSFGKEFQKGRNSEDIMIGLYNIRPGSINSETGKRSYSSVLTSTWEGSVWENVVDTVVVNRDGSTSPPRTLRPFEENFITTSVRAIGLSLMVFAWILALASLVLVGWLRKDPVVQRAQPFFMQILCLGSILMSTTIFTLSFDEGAGWTDRQLDVACTLSPWFFFTGQTLMFSTLFTKLWRVDKVLQFRRTAVTVRNVIGPLIALLTITMTILIVWTATDPWTWERVLILEIPAETYGQCTSNHTSAFFLPLVGVLFFAELLTMYFAWKTADVPEDFRDSSAVMYACFAQIQAWAIGVPMLAVIGTASADGTYFGRVFLVWLFAVSGVAVVVGPKVYKAIRVRINPELGRKKGRVNVSGVYQAPKISDTTQLRSLKVSAASNSSSPNTPPASS